MPRSQAHFVRPCLLLVLLAGCGDDDTGSAEPSASDGGVDAGGGGGAGAPGPDGGGQVDGPPTPKVQATVEPFPFTTELSEDAAGLLSSLEDDGLTLVFEGASGELDALVADRIVIVPPNPAAPTGLLRRIDVVERDGDTVTLRTRQASILHAFRKVDITVEAGGPSDPAMLPTIGGALSVDSKDKFPFEHDVDWVVFDGDEQDSTTEDRVLVSGVMQAAVGYTFHLSFDYGALEDVIECVEDPGISCIEALNPLEIAAGIGFELTFVANLSAGADLTVSGAAALSFEREIPLGEPIVLGVINAGPIVLVPRLAASAGVQGGASAKLDVEVEVSGGVEFGIEASGVNVQPVGKGPYLDTPKGSATIQNSAEARAWVNPRVELLFYDVVGPTIGVEPYAKVTADTDQDPCWRLEGGLDATLGIFLGVGPVTLIDEDRSVPITSEEFASGECPLPDGPGGGSLDPTFESWAEYVDGALYSGGSIDASSALAFTPGGGLLFTATTSTGVLALSPDGEPLFIEAYARDQIEPLYTQQVVSLLDTSLLIVGARGTVLRADATGALLSAGRLSFAGEPNTHVPAIARTVEGGAWAAGYTPQPAGDDDGWVARFAPDGVLLDAFAVRGPLDERPQAIVLLDDGGALIAGESFDAGSTRGWAARVDAEGSARWFVRIIDCAPEGGLGEDDVYVRDAALTGDGNFVLAGFTFYPSYRGMLVKLAQQDGGLSWGQTYAGDMGLGLQLEAVSALESGGFLVGGTQVDIGPNDAIVLAETDSGGSMAWMQRYDTPGRDGHVSLLRTPADNGVVLGATVDGLTEGQASALIMKVPRKDGAITFAAGSVGSASSISVTDADVCLATEPYAGGVTEPIANATLDELPLVAGADVTPQRTGL